MLHMTKEAADVSSGLQSSTETWQLKGLLKSAVSNLVILANFLYVFEVSAPPLLPTFCMTPVPEGLGDQCY